MIPLAVLLMQAPAFARLLYDNGPLVNSVGTGIGGANESVRQNITLGMGTSGFDANSVTQSRVSDDFTVPSGSTWEIKAIAFFAYQTGSTTTPTITGITVRIWDGPPNEGGSTIVFGDAATNRLVNAVWSDVYRVSETSAGTNTDRPVMEITAAVEVTLTSGTYWVDWAATGSVPSGPWTVPLVVNGIDTTGNAIFTDTGGVSWSAVMDGGTDTQQGIPFRIYSEFSYYLPWYLSEGPMATAVAFRNSSGSEGAEVTWTVYGTHGAVLDSDDVTLGPNGQDSFVVGRTLDAEGWIRVDSDQPLTGLAFVADGSRGNLMADITLIPGLSRLLHVPHAAQTSTQWDTGICICAPNSTQTSVQITFLDTDGDLIDQETVSIAANGSTFYELGSLSNGEGSVVLTADQGIAAFAAYYNIFKLQGGYSFSGISAVDPRVR